MKKIISAIITLGLLGTAVVYMSSCAKQAGPLNPDVNLFGINSDRGGSLPYVTAGVFPSAVSETAKITFSMAMDPSSFTAATVQVYTLADAANTESIYTDYTLSYNAVARELSLIPTNSAWANNKYYHLVLTTGISSTNHKPLDGNHNDIAEGDAFDAYHAYDTLGTPPTAAPGYVEQDHISVASISLDTNTESRTLWGGSGMNGEITSFERSYTNVTITVTFGCSQHGQDTLFSMDTTSLVASNLVLTDSTGAVLSTPIYITTSATGFLNDKVELYPNFLPNGKYYLQLKGGVAGIRSASDGLHRLSRGFYLDGNNNSKAELSDDTKIATLRVKPNPTILLNTITGVDAADSSTRKFTVNFSVLTGTGILNPATVNTDTFKLLNCGLSTLSVSAPGTVIIPSKVELDNTSVLGSPKVYVYVPMKFTLATTNTHYTLKVVVTNQVRADDGSYIDADNDGIPGTDKDYYLSSPGVDIISYATVSF